MAIIDNPNKFADKYLVKSSRLKNWNYSNSGYYFITICTLNHNNFFGKIIDNKIDLSKTGIIASQCLINIPKHFSNIHLDEYVVMPNHVHMILKINGPFLGCRDAINRVSTQKETKSKNIFAIRNKIYSIKNPMINYSLSTVIRYFKAKVTFLIRKHKIFFAWQTRFYDHIIRNQKEYFVIKKYIENNIKNWNKDKYFTNKPIFVVK